MSNFRPRGLHPERNPVQNRFTPLSADKTLSLRPSSPQYQNKFVSKTLSPYKPTTSSPQQSPSSRPPFKNLFSNLADFPTLPSAESSSQNTPSSPIDSKNGWVEKFVDPIIELDEEFEGLNYKDLIEYIFIKGFYFISADPLRTRDWYEAVLLYTKSVLIENAYQDDRDRPGMQRISYSKCTIKQIYSIKTWTFPSMVAPIAFPAEMKMLPPTFNYIDYIQAWKNFLFIRPFSHTWFLQLKMDLPEQIPVWFYAWWEQFGISGLILPVDKLKRLNDFMNHTTPSMINTSAMGMTTAYKELMFFFKMKFPWIVEWSFTKTTDKNGQVVLSRMIKLKWWKPFDEQRKKETVPSSVNQKFEQKLKKKQEMEALRKNLDQVYEEILSEGSSEHNDSELPGYGQTSNFFSR